jgi:hypothetical protein
MDQNNCDILMPQWCSIGYKDETGCIKPHAHNDSHIFIDKNGYYIEWEDDYNCTCGCWEEYDSSNTCKILKNLGKMDNETLIEGWNNLSQDEKNILGRPNFACGQIAARMREIGFECPPEAEREQAMVIHTMLKFHEKYGTEWATKMTDFLKNG